MAHIILSIRTIVILQQIAKNSERTVLLFIYIYFLPSSVMDFEFGWPLCNCGMTRELVKALTSFVILPSVEWDLSYKNTACPKTINGALLGHLR